MKRLLLEGEARKDFYERKKRGELNRTPLITFEEICKECGVTKGVMVSLFRKHEDRPKPVFPHLGAKPKTYYNPIEFRAWWKKIQENK